MLQLAKCGLSARLEDLGDGTVTFFEQLVRVDELHAEAVGEEATRGRLAGSHEAGENDVGLVLDQVAHGQLLEPV